MYLNSQLVKVKSGIEPLKAAACNFKVLFPTLKVFGKCVISLCLRDYRVLPINFQTEFKPFADVALL